MTMPSRAAKTVLALGVALAAGVGVAATRPRPAMPKITKPVMFDTPEADKILQALQVFPPDNPWNQDISGLPVHPDSAKMIASIGADKALQYNLDMNFIIVPADQELVEVKILDYPNESDPGPFPLPENAPIENWPLTRNENSKALPRAGQTLEQFQREAEGDRHIILVDPGNGKFHEFWQSKRTDAGWQASNAATWNLRTGALRPERWTSADAAGLPIFPAAVRYDECARGLVEHAMRFTIRRTRRSYVLPATHWASPHKDPALPRMGERFRLRKAFDVSGFPPHVQAILKGLKTYGMFVADNGSDWWMSIAPDRRLEGLEALHRVKGSDFEVVATGARSVDGDLKGRMNVVLRRGRRLKVCMVGCGEHAWSSHGPAQARYATTHPGVELVACADRDAERASRYASRFGFSRSFTDSLTMLDAEKPDAVVLVVPEAITPDLAAAILERGLPVLIEKPPGRTAAEIDRLIAAADRGGRSGQSVPQQVAFNRRFAPLVREMRRRLASLSAGPPIQHVQYEMTRLDRRDPDFSITAIHAIDAVRYLTASDFVEVRFRYQEHPALGAGVANVFLDAVMASGTTAHLAFCPNAGVVVERAQAHAAGHSLFLQVPMWNAFDSPGRLQHLDRGVSVADLRGDSVSDGLTAWELGGFYAEYESFLGDLAGGRPPSPSLREARQSVVVAEHIRERRSEFRA